MKLGISDKGLRRLAAAYWNEDPELVRIVNEVAQAAVNEAGKSRKPNDQVRQIFIDYRDNQLTEAVQQHGAHIDINAVLKDLKEDWWDQIEEARQPWSEELKTLGRVYVQDALDGYDPKVIDWRDYLEERDFDTEDYYDMNRGFTIYLDLVLENLMDTLYEGDALDLVPFTKNEAESLITQSFGEEVEDILGADFYN